MNDETFALLKALRDMDTPVTGAAAALIERHMDERHTLEKSLYAANMRLQAMIREINDMHSALAALQRDLLG